MAKKYVFVRMPLEIYKLYTNIKLNMEKDIKLVSGREIRLTMPKVFKAVASPRFNENYIQIDMGKLLDLAREKRRRL